MSLTQPGNIQQICWQFWEIQPKHVDDKQHNSSVCEVKTGAEDEEEDEVDTKVTSVCVHQRVDEVPPCLVLLTPLKWEGCHFTNFTISTYMSNWSMDFKSKWGSIMWMSRRSKAKKGKRTAEGFNSTFWALAILKHHHHVFLFHRVLNSDAASIYSTGKKA